MSWSVAATGSAAAVKQSLEEQFKPILENLEKAEGFKHEFTAAALTNQPGRLILAEWHAGI